ncbi:MAG: hypothetical protein JSV00_09475 [bacterium]|nr:MAG: hypothetical protein JSV00_09475 [bacterium]
MVHIIEHSVDLEMPLGSGVNTLIAQTPNRLHLEGRLFKIVEAETQAEVFLSVLQVAAQQPVEDRPHFIIQPESTLPYAAFDRALEVIERHLHENLVLVFGIEHITLSQYRELLERFMEDNVQTLNSVMADSGEDTRSKPVNTCVTIIKERSGRTRCFFSAKTHPFAGEETVDHLFDLYKGKTFLLFRCEQVPFNFMPLICFDYVYRDLQHSNIMAIIEKANEIYYRHHQNLDMLVVIQCNPKPEHKVFRDVATGFYGEHLFKTPGTRDTLTVFVNTSAETELAGTSGTDTFGYSSILCGVRHRLPRIKLSEYKTDDFLGTPVSRLRFGNGTRLYL